VDFKVHVYERTIKKTLMGTNTNGNGKTRALPSILGLMIIILVIVALPFFAGIFWMRLVAEFAIMALYALAYNLVLGQTGMFSFGHGGLYGFGAYALAVPVIKGLVSLPFAFIAAPILTAAIACFIGWFCLRLTLGIYFSILTLAFSQLIWAAIWKFRSITGGDDGITGLQVPSFLASPVNQYFFIIAIVIISAVMIWRVINSPLGFTFKAIRENNPRAAFTGINVNRYKLAAFTLSGLFTGVAGALYAFVSRGAFVEFASVQKSFDPVFAAIFGGMYTFAGPIIGAGFMLALHHFIGRFTEYWPMIAGAILIIAAIFLPAGIVGAVQPLIQRLFKGGRRREGLVDRGIMQRQ
jgi:branched-chain amino acid transport system permease protein